MTFSALPSHVLLSIQPELSTRIFRLETKKPATSHTTDDKGQSTKY